MPFAGLTPLILNDSPQAQLLVPMAISLAFGIMLSSVAALLVVPAFWLALHSLTGRDVSPTSWETCSAEPRACPCG